MSSALGSGRRGLSDSYRLKTCGVPQSTYAGATGITSYLTSVDPGGAGPQRLRTLRTRLVEGEGIDHPLDISSLRGARETLRATTSCPFCEGATDFPQIRRSWTSSSLGRIHSRVWEQTHTRSNSPATPPTIFYRGCLPAAPHASRATGPLGGLRLCPTETGVTVGPAADRILRRGAIRLNGCWSAGASPGLHMGVGRSRGC